MNKLACLFLALVCTQVGLAVEIIPANPVPPYTLVRIKTAPGSDLWILSFKLGSISEVDMEYTQEGMVVFTGPPGSYAVLGKEEGKQFTRVVTIGGTPPGPGPGPGPGPDPDPEPEPTTVSQTIHRMVVQHVQQPNPTDCAALARVYRDIAARIDTDLFTPTGIRDATRVDCSRVLQGKITLWTPFYTELAKYLLAWSNEKPRSREDYRSMWTEIAAGFDLVK